MRILGILEVKGLENNCKCSIKRERTDTEATPNNFHSLDTT